MYKILIRWWARHKYIFDLEADAARTLINSELAARRAKETRELVEQLNREADEIEASIKEYAEKEEAGIWLCECGDGDTDAPPVPQDNGFVIHCEKCGAEMKLVKRSEMSGQEKYESDKERKDAEQVVENKRSQAKQEAENVTQGERTAQLLRLQSENSRMSADRIRAL